MRISVSHPVISGVITASGVIMRLSQIQTPSGIDASGGNLAELLMSICGQSGQW